MINNGIQVREPRSSLININCVRESQIVVYMVVQAFSTSANVSRAFICLIRRRMEIVPVRSSDASVLIEKNMIEPFENF